MSDSNIPYSVRGQTSRINQISGFNFDDISTNTLIKKVDANNAGNSNIKSSFTASGSVTNLMNGDPTGPFTVLGAQIVTSVDGTDKQIEITVGLDQSKRSIIIKENEPIVIEDDLTVENLNVTGQIQVNGAPGTAGSILTSNGTSDPTWNTKVIVGAHLTTNTTSAPHGTALTIKYNVVDFDDLATYNSTTGVFTAPRDGYYNITGFARVSDFSIPNASRIMFSIQKKVGGTFVLYAETDTADAETNIKAGTGNINMILKLVQGDEILTTVAMDGVSGNYALRGSDFTSGGESVTVLSINSVD